MTCRHWTKYIYKGHTHRFKNTCTSCTLHFVIISRPKKFLEKAVEENGHPEAVVNGSTVKDRHGGGKGNQNLSSGSDTDDDDLFVNPNHIQSLVIHSDSDSSDDGEISGDESSTYEDSDVDCPSNEDAAIKTIIDNNNTN